MKTSVIISAGKSPYLSQTAGAPRMYRCVAYFRDYVLAKLDDWVSGRLWIGCYFVQKLASHVPVFAAQKEAKKWNTKEMKCSVLEKSSCPVKGKSQGAAAVCHKAEWWTGFVRSDAPEWGGSNWTKAEIYDNRTAGWEILTAVSRPWINEPVGGAKSGN